MSLEIGQKVGPYEVVDYLDNLRIGAGYIVRNTAQDRVEVLRLLPKDPHHDRESVDRFLREIIVHSRLSHPHIISFYSALDIDGSLVMTTEYVPGMTLAQRIEQGGISIAEAAAWTRQVLSALSYAHENGVVHREVSPANIIITETGEAKLAGFGLAKGTSDPELTRVGTVMGWIEYMSPEQVQGLPRVDARSDVYSTGAVLYELVTGRVPFQAGSQFEVMLAHVRETPKPPAELNPEIPPALSQAILQALEKDPEKRFESAEAFRAALDKAAPAMPVSALSPAEPAPAAVTAPLRETPPPGEPSSPPEPAAEKPADAWVFRSVTVEEPARFEPELEPSAAAPRQGVSATLAAPQGPVAAEAAAPAETVLQEASRTAAGGQMPEPAAPPPTEAILSPSPDGEAPPLAAAAGAVPHDAKPEPVPHDAKPQPVPHDANPQPVPHDAKPEPMPHDANPQPVPHDAKPEPVPHYAKPEPMPHDAKPEPVPHDAKPEPVPHDAKPEPMPHDAKPEPMPHDAKPQPVPHDADPQPVPAKAPQPSGAFTWRPKTEEEIEAQQRALEAAPEEPPARLDPPAWARPAAPPPLSDLTTAPPPDLPSQAQSLEALLSEDPLSVAASRAYVHPPKAPETATPAEPLPTWKLVAAGAGAFVLVGLTMYAILRSFGG